MSLRFATRASALARQQTRTVIQALEQAWTDSHLECSQVVISTRGDRELTQALPEIGGKGLFTLELEAEILAGRVDAAVHSLKDLPVEEAGSAGFGSSAEPVLAIIGAIPQREEARDVLVSVKGYTLDTLPEGARVGTSSPRRAAQLLANRADLEIGNLRGNVDSRIRKVEEGLFEAIVLAAAGLIRLGREDAISEWLTCEQMLPAPGQGALAVQCRSDDKATLRWLSAIDDAATRRAVQAERAFLSGLGGGCALPVAAYATADARAGLFLRGLVASLDGRQVIRVEGEGNDPQLLGEMLARQAVQAGASQLLK